MSFAATFQRSRCGQIVLYYGTQNHIPCYFYIHLHPARRDIFLRLAQKQPLIPSEWGEVLCYGAGITPSGHDASYMLEHYGFHPAGEVAA